MPDFKVAIVGAGYTAKEHIRAFKALPGVQIAGIHSRTKARAETLADEFQIPIAANSIAELYEQTQAGLVVVTVPELSMNAVAKASFSYPWTVLTEKPLGYDLSDALDIQKAARASGTRVYVALNRRMLSSTQAMLDELAETPGTRFIKVQDQENQARALAAGQPQKVVDNWMFANSVHLVDYFTLLGRGSVTEVVPILPWNAKAPGTVISLIKFDSGDIGLYEGIWSGPGPWAVSTTVATRRWELRPVEQLATQVLGSPVENVVPPPARQGIQAWLPPASRGRGRYRQGKVTPSGLSARYG